MSTIKTIIDLDALDDYDGLIKQYISAENTSSYKTILLKADGTQLYLYKDANATISDTPDYIINLGTRLTLNGVNKAGTTASIFAPAAAGTSGQVLTSGGSDTAPNWSSIYTPSYDATNKKIIFSK